MADNALGKVTADLIHFVAVELQNAFTHIAEAMDTYSQTGSLPPSMFEMPAPTNKRQKRKDKGHKRKPSAFNIYVKEKMADIRANGNDEDAVANGTNIFSQAVEEWKKLSDEEKKAYAEKYKAEEGDHEGAEEVTGDEEMEEPHEDEEEEEENDEEEHEKEEPKQEPAPQEPPKVELPEAAPQPAPPVKKEKKRKNADAEEPKPKKEKAAQEQAAAEEPKSEKKKKKKKDKQEKQGQ